MDGLWISREEYWRQAERIRRACLDIRAKGFPQPTIFEVDTALAYLYFLDQHCDLVITEPGMGGALDATNAVEKPLCCVFASVGMDHMQMLGSTLEEIAASHGKPTVHAAINWVLKQKGISVALVGARTPEQVRMNAQAADWELTDEENAKILQAYDRIFE